MDWQESSGDEGGWLVTGCTNSTVGVSWIDSKEAYAVGRSGSSVDQSPADSCTGEDEEGEGGAGEEQESEGEERKAAGEEERASKNPRASPREDNLACTKEACLYKSHFILRNHTGEVRRFLVSFINHIRAY